MRRWATSSAAARVWRSVVGRRVTPLVWIAGTLFGLATVLTIGAVVLVLTGLSGYPTLVAALNDAAIGLSSMPYALVGALILSRRANAVGAILLGFGLLGAALAASSGYASHLDLPRPEANGPATLTELAAVGWVAVVGGLAWLAAVTLIGLLVQLFPDGRPLSPRWRPLVWLTLLFPVLFLLVTEFAPETDLAGHAVNPHGLTGPLAEGLVIARAALGGVFGVVFVLSLVSAVLRFRRARGIQRAQLEWFVYGAAITGAANVVTNQLGTAGYLINDVVFCLIPASIGIAILRHRLYDIELLIRRTVSYGATSATVGLAFFAAIVVLETVLRPLTARSEAAVAISTLVAVALFQPIRRRIQDAVDRRFDRSRYDAARTLDRFTQRLGEEVDLDALRGDLLGVVGETMAPAHAGLWLRPPAPDGPNLAALARNDSRTPLG